MSYDTITLRELVGGVLVEAGKENKDIYVIDSDLAKSTTTNQFEEVFPERLWRRASRSRTPCPLPQASRPREEFHFM